MVKATDVFTPNKVPTITYVQRDEEAEQKTRNAFDIPNIVVSLSGPSKSGKTVLVNKVCREGSPDYGVRCFNQAGRRFVE
jgi:hypothetical protein